MRATFPSDRDSVFSNIGYGAEIYGAPAVSPGLHMGFAPNFSTSTQRNLPLNPENKYYSNTSICYDRDANILRHIFAASPSQLCFNPGTIGTLNGSTITNATQPENLDAWESQFPSGQECFIHSPQQIDFSVEQDLRMRTGPLVNANFSSSTDLQPGDVSRSFIATEQTKP